MPDSTVPVVMNSKFHDDIIELSQQRESRFERAIRTDPDLMDGAVAYFDRLGATEVVEVIERHGDTPIIEQPHSRRQIVLRDFDHGSMIDKRDWRRILKAELLPDRYKMNAIRAMERKKDDLIIAALLGDATSVGSLEAGSSTSTVALPSAQKIEHGSAGMTIAKLSEAREILDAAEVDEDKKRYCAVSARQISNLLATTEIKSADYNEVKALVKGDINTYLGFDFIRTERLTLDSNSDRQVICFTEDAAGLAKGDAETIEGFIEPRNDKRYSVQVYVAMAFNATRIEEEQVVEIACQES